MPHLACSIAQTYTQGKKIPSTVSHNLSLGLLDILRLYYRNPGHFALFGWTLIASSCSFPGHVYSVVCW